jgi:multisubunit Na+/H+ antiporter MnhF subunit
MTAWFVAALVLLGALVPCGFVVVTKPRPDALVALELAGTVVVLLLVVLAEAFGRSSYFVLPLVLAPSSIVGCLLFARFLHVQP